METFSGGAEMRLKDEWQLILKKSRTIKFSVAASMLSSLQIVLPYLTDVVPAKTIALFAVLATVGTVVARLTHNEAIDG